MYILEGEKLYEAEKKYEQLKGIMKEIEKSFSKGIFNLIISEYVKLKNDIEEALMITMELQILDKYLKLEWNIILYLEEINYFEKALNKIIES